MAITATFNNLQSLNWNDRSSDMFFDEAVNSSSILSRFSVIDGVKDKTLVPTFIAELEFDDKVCTEQYDSKVDITEKEFSVAFKRWGFQNCKNALESTFRSVYLKRGQNNPETMDAEFAEWVYEYFAKLNGAALVEFSWLGDGVNIGGIKAEIGTDATVTKPTALALATYDPTDPDKVLSAMKAAFMSLPLAQKKMAWGATDTDFRPAFMVGTNIYTAYRLATSHYGQSYDTIAEGKESTWMGLEVLHYTSMGDDEILITTPENLVIVTDDYNDTNGIQTEYLKRTNTDLIWGQYKIGFSYKMGSLITYVTFA